jgi:hypothetical protein
MREEKLLFVWCLVKDRVLKPPTPGTSEPSCCELLRGGTQSVSLP